MKNYQRIFSIFFILLPTAFILAGMIFAPQVIVEGTHFHRFLIIPLSIGLLLLAIGFILDKRQKGSSIRIVGWIVFAIYWSFQPKTLYFGGGGDLVNTIICIIGVYVFFYFAYHEWLSITKNEHVSCLTWIAGATAVAGIVYFGIELTPVKTYLIDLVASQSADLLNIFTTNTYADGGEIYYNNNKVVIIIFACTAVQSMVIFVGMLFALIKKIKIGKILLGLLVTVIPVYLLNLIRNACVVYLLGENITDFSTAHNIIGKIGSLIALVVLLFVLIKFVPEVFDEIHCLTNLPNRNGPIESVIKKIILKRGL